MSVRQSLLAILEQGPCYGHQLRHEFDRRTGSMWPLNVGQIYNTLERLERDGLVRRGETDRLGHVYWRITRDGSAAVAAWLTTPVPDASGARDDLAILVAVAATLPGVDIDAVIARQREACLARRETLRRDRDSTESSTAEGRARIVVVEALLYTADARVRWLEHTEHRMREVPAAERHLSLAAQRPARGRPTRAAAKAVPVLDGD